MPFSFPLQTSMADFTDALGDRAQGTKSYMTPSASTSSPGFFADIAGRRASGQGMGMAGLQSGLTSLGNKLQEGNEGTFLGDFGSSLSSSGGNPLGAMFSMAGKGLSSLGGGAGSAAAGTGLMPGGGAAALAVPEAAAGGFGSMMSSMGSGLASMGGGLLSGLGALFSDERLKKNINKNVDRMQDFLDVLGG